MPLRVNGTTGYTEIAAPAAAGNNQIVLPANNGAANQLLKNSNTAGELTYAQATEDSSGVFAFNSGYGSVAPVYGCRAWVNFNGTAAGTFAGGASTVTRIAGSTTATITTTNDHGLITGNIVYAASGVVAGTYTVTVLTSTTFTITTAATTALSAVAITFNFATIRAAGNINSVAKLGTGDYAINFTTAMPDANYSINTSITTTANGGTYVIPVLGALTSSSAGIGTVGSGSTVAKADPSTVSVAIFR